jgi:hypothetical protein
MSKFNNFIGCKVFVCFILLTGFSFISCTKASAATGAGVGSSQEKTVQQEGQGGWNVIPYDLWNGFTTGMTKKEVLSRAKEVLQIDNKVFESGNSSMYMRDTDESRYKTVSSAPYSDDRYTKTTVNSKLPSYKYVDGGNISFYFFNDKLYAARINWANNTDVGKLLEENYGRSTAEGSEYIEALDYERRGWSIWELENKFIYFSGQVTVDRFTLKRTTDKVMQVIDRAIVDWWEAEKAAAAQQRKAEAEAKKREANSGVKF